jgi:hypothetical protein
MRAFLVVVFGLMLLGVGCDDAETTGNPVSGTVTFQGQPLDQGSIQFLPAAGQGTFSGGPIKDGQYKVPAKQGLEPGQYEVRISSKEGGAPPSDELPGEVTQVPKERIPAQFNSRTTLTAEIKEGIENKFDFTIP